ncbi:MAG TPA: SIS domain-containing protein [Acidimicrobiia bacterium]|nr:SIS domain-containing protein [Acidimicrobiia bacterium]
MTLWAEIHEQPAVLEQAIAAGDGRLVDVSSFASRRGFDHVVIAARGTSDNAARYAQYLWGYRNRLSVGLAAPSLFTMYQRPPRLDRALVVAISQSGQSPDLVAVLAEAKRQQRPTVAITNEPASPLARTADVIVDVGAGVEEAVAATKTYTAQLCAIAMLSLALDPSRDDRRSIARIPEATADVLSSSAAIAGEVAHLADADHAVVLGRGFNHATAFEWSLKLQELTRLLAHPYSTADFRHGPVAVIGRGFPVLMVDPGGAPHAGNAELVDVLRRRGAVTTSISDDDASLAAADHPIRLSGGLPEWLTPISAIVAAQLFTYHLVVARGMDPDAPQGISKVTRTR